MWIHDSCLRVCFFSHCVHYTLPHTDHLASGCRNRGDRKQGLTSTCVWGGGVGGGRVGRMFSIVLRLFIYGGCFPSCLCPLHHPLLCLSSVRYDNVVCAGVHYFIYIIFFLLPFFLLLLLLLLSIYLFIFLFIYLSIYLSIYIYIYIYMSERY